LWGYDKKEDANLYETYKYVLDHGVNWFDSADSYGTGSLSGRAEELLGEFSTRYKKSTRKAYIATKLAPYPWRIGVQSMISACRESNARIGAPVDILQLHWPPSLGWQEEQYFTAFQCLVAGGETTQIGVSNYGPKGLAKACRMAEKCGSRILSNQVQFSLLSRQPLASGLVETSRSLGVQLIGYSPLALGLLTDKYSLDKLPTGPRGILFKEYLPSMTPLLAELRDIARVRRKTVSQVALNWNLQKGLLVLVGVRTVEQVILVRLLYCSNHRYVAILLTTLI
jgi:pyridoxine 4-dehydrogenase